MILNIIQTWKSNEVPAHYIQFMSNIRELNPHANFLFFTDEDIVEFVRERCPEYYDTFVGLKYKIQQLDFFRYLAVYYYGGVYLDLDMDICRSFDDLDLSRCSFPVETLGLKNPNFLVGNYAFYSPKGDPFLKHIIENIVRPVIADEEIEKAQIGHCDPPEQVYVYFTTGPELVTRSYRTFADPASVGLLEPAPYAENCFGKYGYHRCYGAWKHPSVDSTPLA